MKNNLFGIAILFGLIAFVAFVSSIGKGNFLANLSVITTGLLVMSITIIACAIGGGYVEKKICRDKRLGSFGAITGFYVGMFVVSPVVLSVVGKLFSR